MYFSILSCIILCYIIIHYSIFYCYIIILYYIVWIILVLYYIVLYCNMLCCYIYMLYSNILCYVTPFYILLCYTIICYISLYNIIIHCNILRYYRGPASEWYEILSNHFRTSKKIRSWFAKNVLFSHPQRFSEYLLESTSSEVGPMNSPLYYILLYSIVHCVWQTILSCSLEI